MPILNAPGYVKVDMSGFGPARDLVVGPQVKEATILCFVLSRVFGGRMLTTCAGKSGISAALLVVNLRLVAVEVLAVAGDVAS